MTQVERHDRTHTGTTSPPAQGRIHVNTASSPKEGCTRVNTTSPPRQVVDTREPHSYTSVMDSASEVDITQADDVTLQEDDTITQVNGTRIHQPVSSSMSNNENIMNRQTSGYEAPPPAYVSVISYKDFYSVSKS